jgi:hypothetical protein
VVVLAKMNSVQVPAMTAFESVTGQGVRTTMNGRVLAAVLTT